VDDNQHARLSELSGQAHALADKLAAISQSALGELEQVSQGGTHSLHELMTIEAEVDSLAAVVWGISPPELKDIQNSLDDLR